jgi:hypothetical protein
MLFGLSLAAVGVATVFLVPRTTSQAARDEVVEEPGELLVEAA